MNGITWADIIRLVIVYGAPFVSEMLKNAQTNKPVSLEEWQRLEVMIQRPFSDFVPKVGP